jgi:hypothetical protein
MFNSAKISASDDVEVFIMFLVNIPFLCLMSKYLISPLVKKCDGSLSHFPTCEEIILMSCLK